jgi:SAM-dependent methyltransferase
MLKSYIDLRNTPLELCTRHISQVSRGSFANEYGDAIQDYSTEKSPLTNRLIKPYITSETHGVHVFDWLLNLVNGNVPFGENILDLGCGAGEFLSKLNSTFGRFGTTIHLGEVKYARDNYKLENVCPIDIREIENYFVPNFFSCIIAHCSLHFISPEEKTELINGPAYNLLNHFGILIVVDYKGEPSTGVENISPRYLNITPQNYTTMGNLMVLRK